MHDIEIANRLRHLGTFEFHEDECISATLVNDTPYAGSLRHLTNKSEIIELVFQMKNLKHLDLRKNNLKKIPSLAALQKLTYLDLESNHLHSVPSEIQNLSSLQYLNLGVNDLTTLPSWLGRLPLKILKLQKNRIAALPELPNSIEILNLYLNNLSEIPPNVYQLENLETFAFGGTDMKSINPKIGNLKKLKWLTLVANRITDLPDSFCFLSNLQGARLAKNEITHLPKNIGLLQNLRQITLYNNRLTSVPDSFYQLKLEKLNLAENPLHVEKIELKMHMKAIIENPYRHFNSMPKK